MSWYQQDGMRTALRKHMLRIDLRIYCGDPTQELPQSSAQSVIKSMLSAAIIKGLDVIGVVSPKGPEIGWMAFNLAKTTGVDLWVVPGQEYTCSDKIQFIVYGLKNAIPPNLTSVQVCTETHKQKGFVLWCNPTKRQAVTYSEAKNKIDAPDAVEIYCSEKGAFQDIPMDLPLFITTGSSNATDMEHHNAFTLMNRKDWENLHLMPPDYGSDYSPGYLEGNNNGGQV